MSTPNRPYPPRPQQTGDTDHTTRAGPRTPAGPRTSAGSRTPAGPRTRADPAAQHATVTAGALSPGGAASTIPDPAEVFLELARPTTFAGYVLPQSAAGYAPQSYGPTSGAAIGQSGYGPPDHAPKRLTRSTRNKWIGGVCGESPNTSTGTRIWSAWCSCCRPCCPVPSFWCTPFCGW